MAISETVKQFVFQPVKAGLAVAAFAALSFAAMESADAAAVRQGLFNGNTLPGNDDGSTGLVDIGFTTNFFGVSRNQLYVNNNGNVTFDSPLSTFTPFGLTATMTNIIAPFFADVDTRDGLTNIPDVTYGAGTVNGRAAFGVNWLDVGYFSQRGDLRNSFQLVLVDRSDIGAGDFDIEFNYDQIQWETGEASGGVNGLGGNSARAGFSNGTGAPGTSFELAGSAVNGAFLDGGPNALISNRLNSDVDGRYVFFARNGRVVEPEPTDVPEPASALGLLTLGALGAGSSLKRKEKKTA